MRTPATAMQEDLEHLEPTVPLLNVLLVRDDTGEPGRGVREFVAARFRRPCANRVRVALSAAQRPESWASLAATMFSMSVCFVDPRQLPV